MEYTYWELALFLIIYSFLGWLIEVITVAIMERKFCNRGFLSMPLCVIYGIIMDILIVLLPTMDSNYLGMFLTTWVIASGATFLAGIFVIMISRNRVWEYEKQSLFGGIRSGIKFSLIIAAGYMLAVLLLHPITYVCVHMLPEVAMKITVITVAILAFADLITTSIVVRTTTYDRKAVRYQKKAQKTKRHMVSGIYHLIWNRLQKAYPNIKEMDGEEIDEEYTFAKGITFEKMIWIFLVCAFLGDIVETVYCRIVAGVWVSRSSVIYGPFSIVWGIGAVLLTIVLHRFSEKSDRYIFILGCVAGGVYEYMCSVFTELVLGTVFWDYSWMPFNIGGRTNLLYCLFWGIAAVVWMKICYPVISRWIEKIPPLGGKIITWLVVVLMSCNAMISAGAMLRYTERKAGVEATGNIDAFLDANYSDELVEWTWPTMKITD